MGCASGLWVWCIILSPTRPGSTQISGTGLRLQNVTLSQFVAAYWSLAQRPPLGYPLMGYLLHGFVPCHLEPSLLVGLADLLPARHLRLFVWGQ